MQALDDIRKDIGEEFVWLAVDETTDANGRYVANVVVGKLVPEQPSQPHLIVCRVLEKTNSDTIARVVNSAMGVLWKDGVQHDRVLLLLTDAAAYMVKAGRSLSVFYPNLIHVRCIVHGLHRVAETVRVAAPSVNSLISSVKKVFLKAPIRQQLYRQMCPGLQQPPEPVLTRWGTWLEATSFYAENFNQVKEVLKQLDSTDAAVIAKANTTMQDEGVKLLVASIHANFGFLPKVIEKLEGRTMSMNETLQMLDDTQDRLGRAPGDIATQAQEKLKCVMEKNEGLRKIREIRAIASGASRECPIDPAHVAKFNYAPLTSVEVERSFSVYKALLTSNRHNLTPENMEALIVSHCHSCPSDGEL